MIVAVPVNIQMLSSEWLYILGWIDGKDIPVNLPPTILTLRTKIQETLK
jgi:hypothetical protein